MSEWWSYRPIDFLMFAPRTYWRLFELHNQVWWPAPVLLLLSASLWLLWLRRRSTPALRAGALGLALAWAFVGWFFVHERYAPVNWVMAWGALAFLVQALAVAHALRDAQVLGAGTLALCYVALALLPMALVGLGFADTWLRFRERFAKAGPQAGA